MDPSSPPRWSFRSGTPSLLAAIPVRHAIAALGIGYGVVHYLGQGKGWTYHLYPLAAFAALLAFAELRSALVQRPPRRHALAVSLAATLVWLTQTGCRGRAAPSWIREKEATVEPLIRDLGPLRAGDSVQVLDTTDGGIHALLRLRARQPTRFMYDFHFFHDEDDRRDPRPPRGVHAGVTAHPPRFVVLFGAGGLRAGPSGSLASRTGPLARLRTIRSGMTAPATWCMRSDAIRKIIRAYDDPIVRAYCWARFWILRQRFLDEIGQYLPTAGRCSTSAADSGSSPSTTR